MNLKSIMSWFFVAVDRWLLFGAVILDLYSPLSLLIVKLDLWAMSSISASLFTERSVSESDIDRSLGLLAAWEG